MEKRVVLEFDGKAKYFDYRPTDEAVLLERQRESALVEAGWAVIRLEWKDLFNAAYVKAKVLAALSSSQTESHPLRRCASSTSAPLRLTRRGMARAGGEVGKDGAVRQGGVVTASCAGEDLPPARQRSRRRSNTPG